MNSTLFAVIMAMFGVASQSFLQSKIQSSVVGKSFLSMVAVGEAAPDFELKNSQGDYRSTPSSFYSLIVFSISSRKVFQAVIFQRKEARCRIFLSCR